MAVEHNHKVSIPGLSCGATQPAAPAPKQQPGVPTRQPAMPAPPQQQPAMAALPQQQTAMQAVPMDVDASSSSPVGDPRKLLDAVGGAAQPAEAKIRHRICL